MLTCGHTQGMCSWEVLRIDLDQLTWLFSLFYTPLKGPSRDHSRGEAAASNTDMLSGHFIRNYTKFILFQQKYGNLTLLLKS